MKRRVFTAAVALALWSPRAPQADPLPAMQETPMFADQVKSGALPPVDKRIPEQPSVVTQFSGVGRAGPIRRAGQHADGDRARHPHDDPLRQRAADRVRRPFQAAARYPGKLRGQGSREFTFKLRPGHKWSDGAPFTTEDFRYFWEDIANNKELTPGGPNIELMVDGKPSGGRDHRPA